MIGGSDRFTAEHRALNAVLLLVTLVGGAGAALKLLFGRIQVPVVLGAIVLLAGLLYYLSRFQRQFNFAWRAFAMLSFLFAGVLFMVRGGVDAPLVLMLVIVFAALLLATPRKYHRVWIVGHALVFFTMLGADVWGNRASFNHPDALGVLLLDHLILYTITIALLSVAIFRLRIDPVEAFAAKNHEELLVERLRSDGLKHKSEFHQLLINLLAHDVKAPLTSMNGYLELLDRAHLNSETERHLRQQLTGLTQTTNWMVEHILTWSSTQLNAFKPHLTTVSTSDVIDEVLGICNPIAKVKNVRLIHHPEHEVLLQTDAVLLASVLRNLLVNGIVASPENSDVAIEVRKTPSTVEFTVIDKGRGMPGHILKQLFSNDDGEPALSEGSRWGIGLRISREFTKILNGELKGNSTSTGTSLTFSHPVGEVQ
jgi:signal transduction histidine kinase